MFILVFRPHQRTAWAQTYSSESDFVAAFLNDAFATNCHAEADGETLDKLDTCDHYERYAIAFDVVAHDLNTLTRLDAPEEVAKYLNDRDYCGHHNKGLAAVTAEAAGCGWLIDVEEDE